MASLAARRSYAQLCGIATGLDLVGERWALLIIRDLLLGPMRFSELAEGLPGIGTNTLTTRLRDLESAEIVERQLLPMPDRAAVYQLTEYGRELEPILMALGRWGTRSMGRLPADVTARSRWLVAALIAFHDPARPVAATVWQLHLRDGVFTVEAVGTAFSAHAGPSAHPDVVATVDDADLHRLLTAQLSIADAVEAGALTIDGEAATLQRLLDLCAFG